MKDLDTRVCNGVTFKFVLFEPKSLVTSTLNEIARVSLVRKGAVVDGHSDNLSGIKKNSYDDFHT